MKQRDHTPQHESSTAGPLQPAPHACRVPRMKIVPRHSVLLSQQSRYLHAFLIVAVVSVRVKEVNGSWPFRGRSSKRCERSGNRTPSQQLFLTGRRLSTLFDPRQRRVYVNDGTRMHQD